MKNPKTVNQIFKSIKEKYDNQKRVVKEEPMIPYSSDDDMGDDFWNEIVLKRPTKSELVRIQNLKIQD